MVTTPYDFLSLFFFLNLLSAICMLHLFLGPIHHLTSSQIAVKTKQKVKRLGSAFSLQLKGKKRNLPHHPLSLPLLVWFPLPKVFSPFYLIKSYWSRLHSALSAAAQAFLVPLVQHCSHLPQTILKNVHCLVYS